MKLLIKLLVWFHVWVITRRLRFVSTGRSIHVCRQQVEMNNNFCRETKKAILLMESGEHQPIHRLYTLFMFRFYGRDETDIYCTVYGRWWNVVFLLLFNISLIKNFSARRLVKLWITHLFYAFICFIFYSNEIQCKLQKCI